MFCLLCNSQSPSSYSSSCFRFLAVITFLTRVLSLFSNFYHCPIFHTSPFAFYPSHLSLHILFFFSLPSHLIPPLFSTLHSTPPLSLAFVLSLISSYSSSSSLSLLTLHPIPPPLIFMVLFYTSSL